MHGMPASAKISAYDSVEFGGSSIFSDSENAGTLTDTVDYTVRLLAFTICQSRTAGVREFDNVAGRCHQNPYPSASRNRIVGGSKLSATSPVSPWRFFATIRLAL